MFVVVAASVWEDGRKPLESNRDTEEVAKETGPALDYLTWLGWEMMFCGASDYEPFRGGLWS